MEGSGRRARGGTILGSVSSPPAHRFALVFVRVWSGLAIAFGITFAIIGAIEWDRAAESAGWPTAPGVVTESRVVHSASSRRGSTKHHWSARIAYRFEVSGERYEASRIGFRIESQSEGSARALAARFPVGSAVTVHHAPEDPTCACLEPGAGEGQWLPLALGALAVVVGGWVGWFVPRRIRALKQAAPP